MSSDQSSSILFLVIIAAAFWFLVIRPTRKRQAQSRRLQDSLDVGQQVMLTSGIYGEVIELGDTTVLVEVAEGVEITVHRQAVAEVVPEGDFDEETVEDEETGEDDEPADETVEEPADEPADERPGPDTSSTEGRTDGDDVRR